ncbi:MAG: HD domain-containing protein [Haloarculaceae archaeon]
MARSYFDDETSPAHDWHHVQRVEANAERLVEALPGVDGRVVRLAVLLHDVGRAREDRGDVADHAAWGAREARELLADRGVDDETVDAVAHCVRAHRYSTGPDPQTTEARVLADADNLDALGAVGVARCFTYGGELGQPIHDPAVPPEADQSRAGRSQFNHFHKKILDLPDRMYTEPARRLASERADYVRDFLDRMAAEVAGEQ